MFANCTHIMVSLLKAWKVTMVGIQEGPHKILQGKNFFSKFYKQYGKLDLVDVV